jgi:hypothetical protein
LLGILIAGSPRLRQRIKLRFLLIIVTGEQRPHGTGDAAILLDIVRLERIVQLIEEDRQAAVPLAQRGLRNIFLINELLCFYDTALTQIYTRYIYVYKQPFRGGRIGRAGGLAGIDSA